MNYKLIAHSHTGSGQINILHSYGKTRRPKLHGVKVQEADQGYHWPRQSYGKTRRFIGSKVKKQIWNMIGRGRASETRNYGKTWRFIGVKGQETDLGYDWPRQRDFQPTSLMQCRGQGSQPDNQSPKELHASLGSIHLSQPRTHVSIDTTPKHHRAILHHTSTAVCQAFSRYDRKLLDNYSDQRVYTTATTLLKLIPPQNMGKTAQIGQDSTINTQKSARWPKADLVCGIILWDKHSGTGSFTYAI